MIVPLVYGDMSCLKDSLAVNVPPGPDGQSLHTKPFTHVESNRPGIVTVCPEAFLQDSTYLFFAQTWVPSSGIGYLTVKKSCV